LGDSFCKGVATAEEVCAMPWKEMSPKMHKVQLLADWRKTDETMLCAKHGISRKTGYKLIARWRQKQEGAFIEYPSQSHAPIAYHAIIELREKHPTWGPKKLRPHLAKLLPHESWPALSTMGDILTRAGLVQPRARPKSRTCPHEAMPPGAPNDVWTAD
jgi:hypothetical protein